MTENDADDDLPGAAGEADPPPAAAARPERPLLAGAVAALTGVILVCAASLGLALLVHGAHTREGCSGQYDLTSRDCTSATGENGFLADWSAVLWASHGVGISTGVDLPPGSTTTRDTGVVTGRFPLGAGMLGVLAALWIAGRVGGLFGDLRSRAPILTAAAVAATGYPAAMALVGVVATARGAPGQAVGPDLAELVLLLPPLALLGSAGGMLREARGPGAVRAVLGRLRDRAGAAGAAVEGALAGGAVGLAIAALLAVVGMLARRQDTADAAAAMVRVITSNAFPETVVGTVATVVLLILALPGLAVWMLCFGLVVPKVDLLVGGTAGGGGIAEHDLLRSPHPGWLWLAVAAPLAAGLLCGRVAARRGRAATPAAALRLGAGAGAVLALLVAGLTVLLAASDAETLTRSVPGAPTTTSEVVDPLGPALGQSAAGALLLIPLAGLGGWLALALVERPPRLPGLRRRDAEAPAHPDRLHDELTPAG